MPLLVKKLDLNAKLPTVTHPGEDLGFDLYALEDIILYPNRVEKVKTGISARFVKNYQFINYGLLFRDRSSMASKGITMSGGVVDSSYNGHIMVLLTNNTKELFQINAGDKIVQMIPQEVMTNEEIQEVDELPVGNRNANGFGSSGR